MKTEQPLLITSVIAKTDVMKNHFIGYDGGICQNNAKALGVSNADTSQDEQLPVTTDGIVLITTGAAISKGGAVQSDASGKAVPLDAGIINGYALDDSTGADELIRIHLH